MDARVLHPAPEDAAAGHLVTLGDYLLSPGFARRATADVYDATHAPTGAPRRVYVLRPGAMQDNPLVHRVVCEADAARWLRHSATAKLEAYGDTPSRRLYVAVERPAGRPLGDLLADSGRLAPWRVVRLAGRLVEALDEAHAVGLVHGRLTPAAVVVAPEAPNADGAGGASLGTTPAVTLTGLGTAAVDGGPVAAGDRPYVSPEQLAGREPDVQSDVFGLASLLQHALTGAPPAECDPAADPMLAALAALATPPSLSDPDAAAVEGVLAAARAADPRKRPATIKAFWEDLLEALVADAVRATQGAVAAGALAADAVDLPAAPLDEDAALAHLELAEFALAPAGSGLPPGSAAPTPEPSPVPALTFGGLDVSTTRPWAAAAPRRPVSPAPAVQPRWTEPRTPYPAPARRPARGAERAGTRRGMRAALVHAWWLAVPAVAAAVGWPATRGPSAPNAEAPGAVPAATAAWPRVTAPPVLETVTATPRAARHAAAAAGTLARRDADASGVADEVAGPTGPQVDLPAVELPAVPAAAPAPAPHALVRPDEFTKFGNSGAP